MNPLLERITIDSRISGGKPSIKGTRIWVSLILDFLSEDMTEAVARYPPAASAGIVVLEIGRRATHAALLDRVRELVILLNTRSPEGALWIVEPSRGAYGSTSPSDEGRE